MFHQSPRGLEIHGMQLDSGSRAFLDSHQILIESWIFSQQFLVSA
jgi:hypothetical protein